MAFAFADILCCTQFVCECGKQEVWKMHMSDLTVSCRTTCCIWGEAKHHLSSDRRSCLVFNLWSYHRVISWIDRLLDCVVSPTVCVCVCVCVWGSLVCVCVCVGAPAAGCHYSCLRVLCSAPLLAFCKCLRSQRLFLCAPLSNSGVLMFSTRKLSPRQYGQAPHHSKSWWSGASCW